MTTDQGHSFGAAALLSLKNVHNLTYGGGTIQVPISVRVIWRKGPVVFIGGKEMWSGGTTLGDQTIQIANRIPDDLLDEIRAHGGALRIKIRLMDDRVLLGWDIEKIVPLKDWKPGTGLHSGINYLMPGGDFYEGVPIKGGFSRRPWYLNAQGQRVEVEADD